MFWLGCASGLVLALTGVLEPAPAPRTIDQVLGGPVGRAEAAVAEWRRDVAIEALTLACMDRAGLPYTPGIDAVLIPDADLGPVAWAERWGFGIATSVGVAPAERQGRDPNVERVGAMAPEERERYAQALDGPAPFGCRRAATEAVHGLRARLLDPLAADLDAMYVAIEGDPARFVAERAWQRCLGAARIEIHDRATTIPILMGSVADRLARVMAKADSGALRALQAEERRLAVAAARCERGFIDAMTPVTVSHEERFVSANRRELERIRRAIADAEAGWPTIPVP